MVPLSSMKFPSLSLLTNFGLKSTLSDIRVKPLPFYWVHVCGRFFPILSPLVCGNLFLEDESLEVGILLSIFVNLVCQSISFD